MVEIIICAAALLGIGLVVLGIFALKDYWGI